MTKITLLVEHITKEKLTHPIDWLSVFTTPVDSMEKTITASTGPSWSSQNKSLCWSWTNTDEFDMVEIQNFNAEVHENPFYLLSMYGPGNPHPLLNSLVWEHFPKQTIDILANHNIPILIWYPLELSSHCLNRLEHNTSFISKKEEIGLPNNELVLVSLSSFYSMHKQKLSTMDIHPDAKLTWVHSVGFLDQWNVSPIAGTDSPIEWCIKYGKNVILDEHVGANKSKLALCLNNLGRPNRKLLLSALHLSQDDFFEMLISQQFEIDAYPFLHQIMMWEEYQDTHNAFISESQRERIASILSDLRTAATTDNLPKRKLLPNDAAEECKDFNRSWNKEWYTESWCSIITETFNGDYSSDFTGPAVESPLLTEKILKPILNCHPFTVFGHAYTNTLLERLGFKTFDQTWFDLPSDGSGGYITILERLDNLLISLRRLSAMSNEELSVRWNSIRPDLEYNLNHLINNNWAKVQKELILNRHSQFI